MTECEVTKIVSYRESYNKILSNLLSEDSFYSLDDYDGLVEDLESYGQETGASENIDVDWTFDLYFGGSIAKIECPDGTMSKICGNTQILLFDYRRQMKQNSGNNYAQS